MRNKKITYSLLSLLIILGLLVSGCGQAKPAAPAAAPAPAASAPTPTPAAPGEDSAKVVKDAVVKYFNDIPTVKDSYKIAEKDLKEGLEKDAGKYLVVDIRKAEDYAKGHIKGAVNVPFGKDIADNLEKIRAAGKGKIVAVYCYTGQTAGQTVALLNIAGVNAKSLHGGWGTGIKYGWAALKYPEVTDAAKLPDGSADGNKSIDKTVKDYFINMPQDIYKIDDEVLKPELDKNADKYLVVDIRRAEDYAKGHIKGAINVPYGPDLSAKLDELKSKAAGKTMVVYCYTGQTAGQADALYNLVGIKTKSLNFGFGNKDLPKSWDGLGYEVVK